MKMLLEFYLKYFDFLYLDPRYRITDSHVAEYAPSVSLTTTGPGLTFSLINERDQIEISVAPSQLMTPENWFWPSLIKQYIENAAEIHYLPAPDEARWVGENLGSVERLFSDTSPLEATCDDLRALAVQMRRATGQAGGSSKGLLRHERTAK